MISEAVKTIIKSMMTDPSWKQDDCLYYNEDVKIWTGNGLLFIDYYPKIGAFNIFEKIALKKAISMSIAKKLTT